VTGDPGVCLALLAAFQRSCVNPSIILQPLRGVRWIAAGAAEGYLTEDVV